MSDRRRAGLTGMIDTAVSNDLDFELLAQRHRRELHVHCYRMTGSVDEADDLVQQTFERAWRRRETAAGPATARAWLYKIATNTCLDALEHRKRAPAGGEVPWLQPCPDPLLEDVVAARETVELAYLVALQHLPARQRAVLLLRDVLSLPAAQVAELLETSTAAVNSALQRAHATMAEHLPQAPAAGLAEPELRALVDAYVEACDAGDVDAIKALLDEDVRFTMPPEPGTVRGRDRAVDSWVEGGFGDPAWGTMRCTRLTVNLQPAVACYARRPDDDTFRLLAVDVLRVRDGAIDDITAFHGPAIAHLGLPPTL